MQESLNKIQNLQQVDIFQNQRGSIINEQIKQFSLYEINLNQECNNIIEENCQRFTPNQFEKMTGQYVKPTCFSTNISGLPTPHNEEPSRWLPNQDDSPLLEPEDNTKVLLKKINEALETREERYEEKYETNEIQELFNKISEIVKPDHERIRNNANKMRANESDHKHSRPHDFFLPRDQSNNFPQGYKKRVPFENHYRMHESANDDIPITHENELKAWIDKYTSSKNIHDNMNDQGFYNSMCLNNENDTIADLEHQFTEASLEYWGNHSIGSVEHCLTQSEWNILKSPNESVNWLQHSFNQSNWLGRFQFEAA